MLNPAEFSGAFEVLESSIPADWTIGQYRQSRPARKRSFLARIFGL